MDDGRVKFKVRLTYEAEVEARSIVEAVGAARNSIERHLNSADPHPPIVAASAGKLTR